MGRKYLFPLLAAMFLIFVSPVMADWVPENGHKMHFPQLPDEAGWDVNATQPLVLADDWMCSETGWVKDIHFWGSWKHGITGQILYFVLSIHADIPASQNPSGYSMPGQTLWEREIAYFIPRPIDPPTLEGWYDPLTGAFFPEDHDAYFQYNVFLEENDWFWQEQGTIYWLNISAVVADPAATQWGWKTSLDHWNDDAVWATWGNLQWYELFEPPGYHYLPGDVDNDGDVDSDDVTFLQAYLFTGGPPPPYFIPGTTPPFYAAADVNGDCIVSTADLTYLIDFLQAGGPPPTFCPTYPPNPESESLDMAFVITAGMQAEPEACCLQDGSCVMALPTDCINVLGGTPQGAGTVCTQPEGCCLPDGTCANLDPLCCADLGGTPQGVGTICTQPQACCLPGGGCTDVDPLCCDEMGGWASPTGAPACLGDGNGNGVDDACDILTGACCLEDGSCLELTMADCNAIPNSDYKGDGTRCLGDNNSNGINDACETWEPGMPAKMHYPQLPNIQGWGVDATYPVVLADDWMCSETGWVKDIHFWGAYQFGSTQHVKRFILSIHADVPAGVDQQYSHPGEILWEYETDYFSETPFDMLTPEGWYSPQIPWYAPGDHIGLYQYDIYLPEAVWFWQDVQTIYWLNITAIFETTPAFARWGWKSSIEHWNDDATWADYYGDFCTAPDNGSGTIDFPAFCPYMAADETMHIIDGLPPGTTIESDPIISNYHNIMRSPGGILGGEMQEYNADLKLAMTGTGMLAGYMRNITIPIGMETNTGPTSPGDPIQIFPAVIISMTGEIVGDPDFDLLRITAGEAHGLPCPGQVEVKEKVDNPDWWVESFFDITYRIDFVGAPGSPLAGMSGSTTGTIRMLQGALIGMWVDLYEPPDFQQSLDLAFVITGEPEQQCDCHPGEANGNGAYNILDVTYLISYLYKGGPAPTPYPLCSGDANCNCAVNILDVTYLISYLYKGGPAPCSCQQWLINCGPPLRK
ncbi:MAG: dockerin type I domain-containing protein [Candidatus Zixiibacteriota bacterium]